MKFTFGLPHMLRLKASLQPWESQVTGPDQLRMARRAEAMGYDQVAVPEHFIIPEEHVPLSGPHYFHGIAAMGAVAGATETIRVNSCIMILPLQNPIVTAKGLSTIDWMSGGRTTVTFGVGWLEGEFDLLGVPFRERGAMADEYLAAMVELWTQDKPEFEGKYVSFRDVAFEPKPVQKPHLPIWMGGDADAVLKRTAKYANGWWPFLTKPDKIGERVDFIKSQPDYKAGDDFEVMYGLATSRIGDGHVVIDDPNARSDMGAQEIIDRLGLFQQQGVTMTGVPIPPVSGIEAYMDHAQWVMEEIKPKL
ncbi:TIGR03619 family F420-dependent LLM class oxidoreductase [Sphingobium sufflavum]|uniref:TIGR03619 family F420-dependent LLM class oxidoreductase n=1 Tax=Sphingobium sufflavum TaxID=1129547 RepID=UPI001F1FCCA6|nr:TIGR03619 family F420-dependent LLM class oxidoreductase [Sphingobium sufflavum]MCE7795460.1 TIGR03619 family F420-dependent LLM class oxidoreductase [Sphingobium sufflavum]